MGSDWLTFAEGTKQIDVSCKRYAILKRFERELGEGFLKKGSQMFLEKVLRKLRSNLQTKYNFGD